MLRQINKKEFDEILETTELFLVEFGATWCKPCKVIEPILEELTPKYNIYKVDCDEEFELTKLYNVKGAPTMIVFKNREVYKTFSGTANKAKIEGLFT